MRSKPQSRNRAIFGSTSSESRNPPIKHITATCLLFDTHSFKVGNSTAPSSKCLPFLPVREPRAHTYCSFTDLRMQNVWELNICAAFCFTRRLQDSFLYLPVRTVFLHFLFLTDSQPSWADWVSFAPSANAATLKVSCNLWMIKWLNNIFKGPHLSLLRTLAGSRCCDFDTKVKDWQY